MKISLPNYGNYFLKSQDSKVGIWPHDNCIIAQGLKKLAYQNEYDKIKEAIIKAYKEISDLPEYYTEIDGKTIFKGLQEKEPDYPQTWSTGV